MPLITVFPLRLEFTVSSVPCRLQNILVEHPQESEFDRNMNNKTKPSTVDTLRNEH